jgi:hypothetical protein
MRSVHTARPLLAQGLGLGPVPERVTEPVLVQAPEREREREQVQVQAPEREREQVQVP